MVKTNNKQKEAEELYHKVYSTTEKINIILGVSKCVGYDHASHPDKFNLIPCLKKITLKNSCEESRDMQMCEKCFNAYCKFLEKISGGC